jgi:hypothetical protein
VNDLCSVVNSSGNAAEPVQAALMLAHGADGDEDARKALVGVRGLSGIDTALASLVGGTDPLLDAVGCRVLHKYCH